MSMSMRFPRFLALARFANTLDRSFTTFARPIRQYSDTDSNIEGRDIRSEYAIGVRLPRGREFSDPPEELERWYHSFLSGGTKSGCGSDKDPRITVVLERGFCARLSPVELKALQKYKGLISAAPCLNDGEYAIRVRLPHGRDFSDPEELERWYHSFISGGTKSGCGSDKDPRITLVLDNGRFCARLTPDEVKALQKYEGFESIHPCLKYFFHTNTNNGKWSTSNTNDAGDEEIPPV